MRLDSIEVDPTARLELRASMSLMGSIISGGRMLHASSFSSFNRFLGAVMLASTVLIGASTA
jgi:hypothetical protein